MCCKQHQKKNLINRNTVPQQLRKWTLMKNLENSWKYPLSQLEPEGAIDLKRSLKWFHIPIPNHFKILLIHYVEWLWWEKVYVILPRFYIWGYLHISLLNGKCWTNPVVEQAKDTAVTTKVDKILSYFNWVYILKDCLPKGILITFLILWSTK